MSKLEHAMPPLRDLIDVRAPYLAFHSLQLDEPGVATALVRSEQPLGNEEGPLAAAEAGRHLAILGACACSSVREPLERRYYLAHRARLIRRPHVVENGPVECKATARSIGTRSGREASAHGMLWCGSERPLFELTVSYKVLSGLLFQRLFAARRDERDKMADFGAPQQPAQDVPESPYRSLLPVQLLERRPDRARAEVSRLDPEQCAGHFPLYPALPVAVLMHALSTLSGEVLRARWGDSARYRVLAADVVAEKLAFAGERLLLDASYVGVDQNHEQYLACARLEDGSQVGQLQLAVMPT